MKPTQEELVKKYINLVYYYAKQWVYDSSDRDDIVQETFLHAFKKYDIFVFQSDNQLKSWLMTICRNVMINNMKAKKPTMDITDYADSIEDESEVNNFLEREIAHEEIAQLKKVFGNLSESERYLLRLRFDEEMSFREICEVLEVPEATAKMRCYRSIEKLRQELV